MRYHVPLIPQQTSMSCWAASLAMILSWSQRQCVDPEVIKQGMRYLRQYQQGLEPDNRFPLDDFGFVTEPLQCYAISGFMELLQQYGPLWYASAPDLNQDGTPDPHIRVVSGFDADPDPRWAMVSVNDPWERGMRQFRTPNRGSRYTISYQELTGDNETLARSEMRVGQPIYVAHLPRRPHSD